MSLEEVLDPLHRWTEAGTEAGLATLVRVRRSAPRPPGARFAVSGGGDLAGSVSSGCVEGDLHEHLLGVLETGEPRIVHYGITDEMAMEVGLACGGEIDVLVEPWDEEDPVWRRVHEVLDADGAAVFVSGLPPALGDRRLLLLPDGERVGSLGSAGLDEAAARAAEPLFRREGTEILELEASDEGAVPGDGPPAGGVRPGGGGEPDDREAPAVFAEALLPSPRIAIVGASPVAAALCRLAAGVGYRVILVDPRPAFATEDKFPDAERILHAWPEEGLREAGVDPWTHVVVLAHDRKIDVPALATALRIGCQYVGQIGGSRTQRIRREALAEEGLDAEQIGRIHGPVGLDIGAETPEEIALSVLSEVVAHRRGRLG